MTERSPAAQAVVNAYAKCVSEWFKLTETEKSSSHYHASGLAASLRAAADQAEIFFDAYDEPRRVVTVDDLLNIAAELEALPDD